MKKPLVSGAKKPAKSRPKFMPAQGTKNQETLGKSNSKIAKHYKKIYLEENENLPVGIKKTILKGNVLVGMTRGQVTASRGSPYKIHKTTLASGVYEQWIMYPSSGPVHNSRKDKEYGYIYFKDGKVSGWQTW